MNKKRAPLFAALAMMSFSACTAAGLSDDAQLQSGLNLAQEYCAQASDSNRRASCQEAVDEGNNRSDDQARMCGMALSYCAEGASNRSNPAQAMETCIDSYRACLHGTSGECTTTEPTNSCSRFDQMSDGNILYIWEHTGEPVRFRRHNGIVWGELRQADGSWQFVSSEWMLASNSWMTENHVGNGCFANEAPTDLGNPAAPSCDSYQAMTDRTALFLWNYDDSLVVVRRDGDRTWAERRDNDGNWSFVSGAWLDASGGLGVPQAGVTCFAATAPAGQEPACSQYQNTPDASTLFVWVHDNSTIRLRNTNGTVWAQRHTPEGGWEFVSGSWLDSAGGLAVQGAGATCFAQQAPSVESICAPYQMLADGSHLFNWVYDNSAIRLRRNGGTLWAERQDEQGNWSFVSGTWMDAAGGLQVAEAGVLCFAGEQSNNAGI